MSESLFEKIINREIPADIIYEDDLSIVIKDIHPQAPTHLLIIPKKVIPKLSDSSIEDQEVLGHLMLVAGNVAEKLNLDNTSESVVVKNVHRHPVKRKILHMDFQRILEDQKISLNVPIRFLGEDVAIGVKMQGGEISKLLNDIEVSCLPKNLPEYLEIDLSNLELNQSLYISDLKLPEGVELNTIMIEQNNAVVSINPPRREEEEIIEDDVVQETDDSESPADEGTPDDETSSE